MVTGNHPAQPRLECPAQTQTTQTGGSKSAHEQYVSPCSDSLLYEQIDLFFNQIAYFDKTPVNVGKGVKSNLCKHIKFWESIGASQFVLDTIREGCSF